MLEAEGREVPGGGLQCLDAINNQPSGGGGKKMVLLETVFTPLQQIAATTKS
ncbi:hypothetical protein D3C87_2025850 [compost metagenome]